MRMEHLSIDLRLRALLKSVLLQSHLGHRSTDYFSENHRFDFRVVVCVRAHDTLYL